MVRWEEGREREGIKKRSKKRGQEDKTRTEAKLGETMSIIRGDWSGEQGLKDKSVRSSTS
jgi:hypothetical protein